jgi:hypothetical protein
MTVKKVFSVKLTEFLDNGAPSGYYNPEDDKANDRNLGDTRKKPTVIRLRDINKLKKMRASERLDAVKREDLLGVMYSEPTDDSGGMGGGGPGLF